MNLQPGILYTLSTSVSDPDADFVWFSFLLCDVIEATYYAAGDQFEIDPVDFEGRYTMKVCELTCLVHSFGHLIVMRLGRDSVSHFIVGA